MKGGKKMELRREEQSDSRRFQKSEVHRGLACAVKVIAEGACRDRRGSEFLVPSTRPGSATSPPPRRALPSPASPKESHSSPLLSLPPPPPPPLKPQFLLTALTPRSINSSIIPGPTQTTQTSSSTSFAKSAWVDWNEASSSLSKEDAVPRLDESSGGGS